MYGHYSSSASPSSSGSSYSSPSYTSTPSPSASYSSGSTRVKAEEFDYAYPPPGSVAHYHGSAYPSYASPYILNDAGTVPHKCEDVRTRHDHPRKSEPSEEPKQRKSQSTRAPCANVEPADAIERYGRYVVVPNPRKREEIMRSILFRRTVYFGNQGPYILDGLDPDEPQKNLRDPRSKPFLINNACKDSKILLHVEVWRLNHDDSRCR